MELPISGSKKKITLEDTVFGSEFNEPLIHQVVTAYLAAGRAGTKAQKTRAEVSGGGIKPWKQKGTGRARAGTIRGPLWRTGGRTFAAKPRCYQQKVNKKMFKGALKSILSELIRQDRLLVVNAFQIDTPKTKTVIQKLRDLKLDGKILIVLESIEENVYLAARNLPHVEVRDVIASAADPVSLVNTDKLVITEGAMKQLEGLLA